MKRPPIFQAVFFCLITVTLLSAFGCAAYTSRVDKDAAQVETAPEKKTPPDEKAILEPKGSDFETSDLSDDQRENEFISSPFGKIPLKKREPGPFSRSQALGAEDETNTFHEEAEEIVTEREAESSRETVERMRKRVAIKDSRKPEPKKDGKAAEPGEIVLNFDNADLYEIIRTLAEILQLNYIVDPNVRGRVTINTAGRLTKEELFPVFFQILEANGLTAVKEGSLYKIIKMKEATQFPLPTRFGEDTEDAPPGERLIIQIIPLDHIDIQEMTKLLTPFVTAGGTIVSHKDSNTILVVDKASNIDKVLKLIDVFDVDFFDGVDYRFFKLEYVNVKDMSKTIGEFVSSFGPAAKAKEEFKLIELERINSLLVISQNDKVFRRIEAFLKKLDTPIADDEPRIYVYSVKNGAADEISSLLNSVFSKGASDKKKNESLSKTETPEERPGQPKELFPVTTAAERKTTATPGERIGSEGSGTLKGEVKITADEIRNSLIIEAVPKDYRIIENILARIDVLPRQVLIEVTLAEIKLDASTELGIQWEFKRGNDFTSGLQSGASLGNAGLNFTYAILDQSKLWSATVKALAQQNKVNILSSPSVLASDNKEAKINVSTEIPVASAEYIYDGSSDNLLQTNIQYRNTGVILSVTPHINEFGLVSMDVNQEVSEAADQVDIGNGQTRQSFFKRSVNTTLTVRNGQTIVIGGLIRENKTDGVAGIPCLGQVPVLSYVFGTKKRTLDKTELIIFITPKVIASLEDVDVVSEEFRQRIDYDPENFKRPGSK